ncbi:rhomboid family intramembrane serine protease [Glycomyces buryatensis]|uniref:Rhomboid family intramembrane serine protease n=1 Tax=Glycomyces buryatensis TaxID=2570927 RepID=A0A4S8PQL4_9ACTN|nr:rhomboid family intramembrane serine protease [Glycomyces buryatensis]THV33440.1 rhomboid family intramembrane serine protease [Glycomyces buryatensis]
MTTGPAPRTHPLRRALALWGAVIAAMWLLLIADWMIPAQLTQWGITPRESSGILPGFIAAPFLHAGTEHLVSNMVPLAVMGIIAALRDWRSFWIALGAIVIVSDLGVWFISPAGSVTVGASGVVFGLFGYLLGRGIFHRRLGDLLIAVALILVYGSMVWGIFPSQPHISWQGHMFGFIGGAGAAYALRGTRNTSKANVPAQAGQ